MIVSAYAASFVLERVKVPGASDPSEWQEILPHPTSLSWLPIGSRRMRFPLAA